mmetsp:Transcript_10574/g.31832  ORF Transcript_10574/g.31832 Transcript_10574/m.31832 type:complete len:95 (-) Transcript_10574:15-299(-)
MPSPLAAPLAVGTQGAPTQLTSSSSSDEGVAPPAPAPPARNMAPALSLAALPDEDSPGSFGDDEASSLGGNEASGRGGNGKSPADFSFHTHHAN